MTTPRAFPHPDTLPIPEDVTPGMGWTAQMIEMADYIGAYATLLVVDQFGGEFLYIAADPAQNRLRDVIGAERAEIMSHVYGRERLRIPMAKAALRHARRQGVIAAVRAKVLTTSDAARMLRTSQPYVTHLVYHTDEGAAAALTGPAARNTHQLDMFGD